MIVLDQRHRTRYSKSGIHVTEIVQKPLALSPEVETVVIVCVVML